MYCGVTSLLRGVIWPKNNSVFISTQNVVLFCFGPVNVFLSKILTYSGHAFFQLDLWEGLAGNLTSLNRLLIVAVLTGNFRSTLIFLEVTIGWVFAILAIFRSIRTVVPRFLPRFSDFGCHFKAFEIILAEQPIVCCTSIYFFPSPISFLIRVRSSSVQCLERPIFHSIRRKCTIANMCNICHPPTLNGPN